MTKKLVLLLSLTFGVFNPIASSVDRVSDSIEIIKIDGLKKILNHKSDQIQVINFWATWCAPCVKELPYFEKLNATMNDRLDVTLISLDFADEIEKRVVPFVAKRKLKSKVVLIDELDYNSWIDTVDPSWSGAIPATLIINPKTGKRKFLEKELEEGELEEILKEFLN